MLRSAVIEDAAQLAAIHRAARTAAMPWLPVLHTPDEDVAFFRDTVIPNSQVTLVREGGVAVAFMAIRSGWIDHLYVTPDHWRRGHGRRLLGFAQAMHDWLQLWTFEGNTAAQAFYAAHGFDIAERTDGSGNEEQMPDLRMVWCAGSGADTGTNAGPKE